MSLGTMKLHMHSQYLSDVQNQTNLPDSEYNCSHTNAKSADNKEYEVDKRGNHSSVCVAYSEDNFAWNAKNTVYSEVTSTHKKESIEQNQERITYYLSNPAHRPPNATQPAHRPTNPTHKLTDMCLNCFENHRMQKSTPILHPVSSHPLSRPTHLLTLLTHLLTLLTLTLTLLAGPVRGDMLGFLYPDMVESGRCADPQMTQVLDLQRVSPFAAS